MKTLTISSNGAWMVEEYVPYENRSYFGPGRLFAQTDKEVQAQIDFYARQGATTVDLRAQVTA